MDTADAATDFCHLAAHDLTAPLRQSRHLSECVRGFLEKSDLARATACAVELEAILTRMKDLVASLLDLSTTANLITDFAPVDMARVVEAALARNRLGILETGASVEIGPLPHAHGDADLLTRALSILICNAILYVDADTQPHIRISGGSDEHTATLLVDDNGIGIPHGYHRRIFDPLVRIHSNPSHFGGFGIGLSLCQKIMRSHGGDIGASPRAEGGTRFTLNLKCPQPENQCM